MHKDITLHTQNAIELLKELIAAPSFSKEEDQTASIIARFLMLKGVVASRVGNNIYAFNHFYDANKPSILLNSHHDTVKPNKGYTLDPFTPIEKDGKLYGLGSNDAGGCLVSLIATFLYFYLDEDLRYNLILAVSAEEENSGLGGIESVLPHLGKIDFGIVGEPTLMEMAIAERGLMVIDAVANGKPGHAARKEGINAINIALADIQKINAMELPKVSSVLGHSTMQVTVINTDNSLHNVVPANCKFVIDVRVNELYTFEEVLEQLSTTLQSELTPRSTRLKSTAISLEHPIVKVGLAMNKTYYGSPTTSDKALMPFPTLKIGPGDSARSHSADEFIFLEEIHKGIEEYIYIIRQLCENK